MKNLSILTLICIVSLSACNSTSQKNSSEKADDIILVDNLLDKADQLVEKQIKLKGHVTHTCKHSGKRAFLVGNDESFTVRIEAGGEINGFDQNLIGNTLVVSGTLKERRLTKEYIDQWENELKDKAEDGSAESCSTELSNINDMRDWMKKHNKDHYSIYFVEGTNYEVVE
ncbi:hypothetical protein [Carboxylicivirga caseinilyticus]|uniref:hypothetical protein n=1 Tax=Carboxylicivirga caseinilyticus TaxID=3417572 RepID=UPI003D34AA68|nr:hypothetical protein [Marinilabiliaceae bacterium A049]